MRAQHGLAHQQVLLVVTSNRETKKRIRPARSRKDVFANTPSPTIFLTLARPALRSEKIIERVLLTRFVSPLPNVADQARGAEVFHHEERAHFRHAWWSLQAVASSLNVRPCAIEKLRTIGGLCGVRPGGEMDSHSDGFYRLPGAVFQSGVERVLYGLSHQRLRRIPNCFRGEEFALHCFARLIARRQFIEMPLGHSSPPVLGFVSRLIWSGRRSARPRDTLSAKSGLRWHMPAICASPQ